MESGLACLGSLGIQATVGIEACTSFPAESLANLYSLRSFLLIVS
jgi:hypothetical protein